MEFTKKQYEEEIESNIAEIRRLDSENKHRRLHIEQLQKRLNDLKIAYEILEQQKKGALTK